MNDKSNFPERENEYRNYHEYSINIEKENKNYFNNDENIFSNDTGNKSDSDLYEIDKIKKEGI
jgi:hypothetical protein